MVGYFNGNDKTLWVMVQGLVQTLLVRLPMAYIMSIQPNASLTTVSYTHLDVYKRQDVGRPKLRTNCGQIKF